MSTGGPHSLGPWDGFSPHNLLCSQGSLRKTEMRCPSIWAQGAPGIRGRGRGMHLRCMLVKHGVKYKGPFPGPVCSQSVLRVFAWVHEHNHLDTVRQRGQGRASQTLVSIPDLWPHPEARARARNGCKSVRPSFSLPLFPSLPLFLYVCSYTEAKVRMSFFFFFSRQGLTL